MYFVTLYCNVKQNAFTRSAYVETVYTFVRNRYFLERSSTTAYVYRRESYHFISKRRRNPPHAWLPPIHPVSRYSSATPCRKKKLPRPRKVSRMCREWESRCRTRKLSHSLLLRSLWTVSDRGRSGWLEKKTS